jgi:hypothetical protein
MLVLRSRKQRTSLLAQPVLRKWAAWPACSAGACSYAEAWLKSHLSKSFRCQASR